MSQSFPPSSTIAPPDPGQTVEPANQTQNKAPTMIVTPSFTVT